MIHTAGKVKDMSLLAAYLEEISLTEASELEYLDDDNIAKICGLLKDIPSKAFKRTWKLLTTNENS